MNKVRCPDCKEAKIIVHESPVRCTVCGTTHQSIYYFSVGVQEEYETWLTMRADREQMFLDEHEELCIRYRFQPKSVQYEAVPSLVDCNGEGDYDVPITVVPYQYWFCYVRTQD